ncbi:MAG: hypothetical protein ACKOBW_00845 [Planctomycetota bacterium]
MIKRWWQRLEPALGWFCVALGLQLRLVESYVLRLEFSQWLDRWLRSAQGKSPSLWNRVFPEGAPVRQTVPPANGIGWAILALGIVLLAHVYARRLPALRSGGQRSAGQRSSASRAPAERPSGKARSSGSRK